MIGKVAIIPLSDIEKVQIYINDKKQTVAQIKAETGSDYIINGGYFNMSTFTPVHWLISGSKVYFQSPWKVYGYRLDSGFPVLAVSDASYTDFIQSAPLLVNDSKVNTAMLISGLDNSNRGRSAVGLTHDALVLRCVPDVAGTDDFTFSELAEDMLSRGCVSAIGLDGGGSSQCDFNGDTSTSTRIVHNLILVFLKKEGNTVPTVHSYNAFVNGSQQLSTNFKVSEFQCKDGSGALLIADELISLLQKIRTHFGKSVTVNSAYRNNSYNDKIGGADGSQHKLGTAADIVVGGVTPRTVAKYAETLMPATGGIGLYEYTSGGFTHVDVRTAKSRWIQKSASGNPVSVSGF